MYNGKYYDARESVDGHLFSGMKICTQERKFQKTTLFSFRVDHPGI